MANSPLIGGVSLNALNQYTFDRWHPMIGDPNIMGWVTVLCYVTTFILCFANLTPPGRRQKRSGYFLVF